MTSSNANNGGSFPQSLSSPPGPFWKRWREEMPITSNWAYFDHAAVAPIPSRTAQAISVFARQASEQGDTVWPSWARKIEEMRVATAHWLNALPEEIAFLPNTTSGVNVVAEGISWRPGDNVVIPGGEFPSNVFPWKNQARHGVEIRVVPSPAGRIDLDGIRKAVDARTRIVSVSWVGYASGYRVPLADICQIAHDWGARLFLDAIQGLGIFPLDLQAIPIDFLAADGHKWLLGPEGAGLAFIRRDRLEELGCSTIGWASVIGSHQFQGDSMQLKPSAARFEGGSANMLGLIALQASLQLFWDTIKEVGAQAIEQRVLELHAYARDRLRAAGFHLLSDWMRSCRSGIITFQPQHFSLPETRERLADAGIAVSIRGGGIRASFHVYNTTEEIDRMLDCLGSP